MADWGILIMISGELEIMAPHIPFTHLEEVQRVNPVTGMPIVVAVLTKGKRVIKTDV
tara:strand:- start:26 stop:196 length:171 start_codon:yes stop_codon:yes gene_type:complete